MTLCLWFDQISLQTQGMVRALLELSSANKEEMGTVYPSNAKRSLGNELLCKEEGSDETSMPNP